MRPCNRNSFQYIYLAFSDAALIIYIFTYNKIVTDSCLFVGDGIRKYIIIPPACNNIIETKTMFF